MTDNERNLVPFLRPRAAHFFCLPFPCLSCALPVLPQFCACRFSARPFPLCLHAYIKRGAGGTRRRPPARGACHGYHYTARALKLKPQPHRRSYPLLPPPAPTKNPAGAACPTIAFPRPTKNKNRGHGLYAAPAGLPLPHSVRAKQISDKNEPGTEPCGSMPDPYMIRGKMMSDFCNQAEALRPSFDYTHIIAVPKKKVKRIKTIFLNFFVIYFLFKKC